MYYYIYYVLNLYLLYNLKYRNNYIFVKYFRRINFKNQTNIKIYTKINNAWLSKFRFM